MPQMIRGYSINPLFMEFFASHVPDRPLTSHLIAYECGDKCGDDFRIYVMGRLSAMSVKAATKPGRYQDGDGFMLLVKPTGARSWQVCAS